MKHTVLLLAAMLREKRKAAFEADAPKRESWLAERATRKAEAAKLP